MMGIDTYGWAWRASDECEWGGMGVEGDLELIWIT